MDVVTISKEVEFDTGHRVPGHEAKCRHPHGHRYRVVVHCSGPIVELPGAPDEGMLVDFGALKSMMTELVHDPLDHAFLCHLDDPLLDVLLKAGPECGFDRIVAFPYVPTAENIARWVWASLEQPIVAQFGTHLELTRVEVWETPTSRAAYCGPPPAPPRPIHPATGQL